MGGMMGRIITAIIGGTTLRILTKSRLSLSYEATAGRDQFTASVCMQ